MNKNSQINPINYFIHLELDVNSENFSGFTEILLEPQEDLSSVILNYDSLEIEKCLLKSGNKYIDCNFEVNKDKLELEIKFPQTSTKAIMLKIIYSGIFHNDLLGLYRSKYEYDNKNYYLISSQLEEIYARRVFPCFDHPSKKAIFDIEFIIDENLKGISNTSIREEILLENGKKKIIFNTTPKMSTYLLYFGVGDFEIKQDESSKYLVRLLTTPSKSTYGELGIGMAIKSLEFFDDFTSIEYPLSKCDLIAIPDFPFGAMENYGAITFRENLLLLYPNLTSSIDKFHIASVVAHEVSHFWFGDLVSPLDWKYIWLNESFASYFTYFIPDKYYPEWHSWDHFILQYFSSALTRDGLINTFPVELPSDEEIFITPAKVGIVYNKGASILRMLVGYLGEKNFRKGIAHFLNLYKYGCANTKQYWNAFEESTGKKVKNFAESWVHQPGYPIIKVEREKNKLRLRQTRFTYLQNDSDIKWLISCSIIMFKIDGTHEIKKISFDQANCEISIPSNLYSFKLNYGQKGFYRVYYEPEELERIGKLIKSKKIPPVDRYGIENDLFALVKAAEIEFDRYLEFIEKYFIEENDYLPLVNIFSNLLYSHILLPSKRIKINKFGKILIEKLLEEIGLEPRKDEKIPVSILRNSILWVGFNIGLEEIIKYGSMKFEDYINGKKVNPDILSSILKIGINVHEGALDILVNKMKKGDLPQIEKLYIYEALGCIKEKDLVNKILDITLKEIPPQTWHAVFFRISSNFNALDKIWPWFKNNLSNIEKGGVFVIGRSISALIPNSGLSFKTEVNDYLINYGKTNEFQKDTIDMVLEQLEINYNFKQKNDK